MAEFVPCCVLPFISVVPWILWRGSGSISPLDIMSWRQWNSSTISQRRNMGKPINSSISYQAKWSRKNGYVKDLKHLETSHFVASLLVETGPCLGNIHWRTGDSQQINSCFPCRLTPWWERCQNTIALNPNMFQHVGVFTQLLLLWGSSCVSYPLKCWNTIPSTFLGTLGTFGPGSHLLQHLDERPGKGRQVARSLAPLWEDVQFLGRNQQKPKTMLGGCKDKQRKGVSKVKPISNGKILLGLAHGVNSVKLVGVVNIGSFCFEVALNALLGNSTM